MSHPRDLIRVYANKKHRKEKLVYAVFYADLNFIEDDGNLIFAFAVALHIEEELKVNFSSNEVKPPSYSFRKMPFEICGLIIESDDEWVHWKPEDHMQRSIYSLLLEASAMLKNPCFEFSKPDWSTANWRKWKLKCTEWNPKNRTDRTQLRWLISWLLPVWEDRKMKNPERYLDLQAIAKDLGIPPFSSESSFGDHHGVIANR